MYVKLPFVYKTITNDTVEINMLN